jgi:ADP-heptose:LPS heptosyltransferase
MSEKKLQGKKIILIISERVGDAIFCTPAIHLLHLTHPDILIDVVALSAYSAQVFEFNPAINKVFVLPSQADIKKIANEYDAIIDLHNSKDTLQYVKWFNKNSFISPRVGEKHQSIVATEFVQAILENSTVDPLENYLLYPQPAHHTTMQQLLKNAGATFDKEEILIGCHIGNYNAAKRSKKFWKRQVSSQKMWPTENIATLQTVLSQHNPHIKLVFTGQPAEEKLLNNSGINHKQIINLIGKTSILELTALMQHLKVFLTGCTGPLHIAAATNIPIVALYGPTFPEQTGPYPLKSHHTILQKNPLSTLKVTEVKEALLKFL